NLSVVVFALRGARRAAGDDVAKVADGLLLPLRGGVELGEAEAGEGFAFAGEELLHEPFFVGLERVEFLAFGSDQLVQRAQALGDFLLFGEGWDRQPIQLSDHTWMRLKL